MRRYPLLLAVCLLFATVPLPTGQASSKAVAVVSGHKMRWSDPATWGGRLPGAGQAVRIPSGARVVLDVSPPAVGGLEVDGTLTFARKRNVELTAEWIMVHGTLRVGTKDRPFRKRAVITLTGNDRQADVMGMGTRFLGVMGGTLEMHGEPIEGWTRLNATVGKGDRILEIEEPMDWGPGDKLVIASSSYWSKHDEERTITAVNGTRIELDRPLERMHWGVMQRFAGRDVDQRAEVALLTRNIVVRGPHDAAEDGFGGHMMFMEGAVARLDGVELEHMGQLNVLRRYPVHFHLEGSAGDSYLKRMSIHHSFNRCITIHGTDDLLVKDNVCFDHVGHGYFLEDGAETGNVLSGNLGLGTRSTDEGLLPSDDRAATFWITNPDNDLIDNVAAGSEGIGFWYALPEHPTGSSTTDDVWPRRTPLGRFERNTAHSNGDGLNVDHGPRPDGTTEATWYRPVVDPADEDSESVTAVFEDFTAYYNRDRAVWLRGENHIVSGGVFSDNRSGATFASSESFLDDSLVVGQSDNPGTVEPWEKTGPGGRALPFFWEPDAAVIGFEFYDGKVGARDTTFVNFKTNETRPSGALGYLAPNSFSISPRNYASGVRLVNATPVYLADPEEGRDGDHSKVFIDSDGSVTGTAGRAVVVNNPFLLRDDCRYESEWNAHVCPTSYVSLMVGGTEASVKPVELVRSDAVTQRLMGCCDDSTSAWTTLFPGSAYTVRFTGGTPARTRFVLASARDRHVDLTVPLASVKEVTRWGRALRSVTGLAALRAVDDSAFFYDQAAGLLHLRLYGNGDWEELKVTTS